MFASPDFVALCQAQVALLTQGLEATLSVVYLAEEMADGAMTNLVPIAAHPEAVFTRDPASIFALLSLDASEGLQSQTMDDRDDAREASTVRPGLPGSASSGATLPDSTSKEPPGGGEREQLSLLGSGLPIGQRMMVPLTHEGTVLGVLVTARADRPWGEPEQAQIERVARSLAIACVLDRRAAWTDHNLHQLEQLQSQQHELFDNLLHQFRNPLMALRTFGKVLLKRMTPNSKSRNLAEGIIRESEHLQELLNQFEQVLDLQPMAYLAADEDAVQADMDWPNQPPALSSRTDTMPLLPGANALAPSQLTPVSCAVAEILNPLLESAQAIAQDRKITLLALIPDDLPAVYVDPGALREALNNLIDNALKYTPTRGQVEVLAGLRRQRNNQSFQGIAVIDNGPGIPSGDQEHLFERHFRGVQASSDIPGTGLGLAISRDLVRRMQGDVEVFSPAGASGLLPDEEGSDRGTVFMVWLPEANN